MSVDKRYAIGWLVVLALLAPPVTRATNGMFLTGYGAETLGRAGANLAISDRSLALNFNPAGIAQLQGNHLTASLSVLAPSLEFQNMINRPIQGEDRYFPLPAVAYVRGGKETRWTWGVGMLAQGGMGATFNDQNTFFGTRDGTYSEVRFMTLSPTLAYSISEDAAVGVTLNIGYADASFKFYEDTSFFNPMAPEMSFFGVNMKRAKGLQTNVRVGWWWRAHPRVSFGAIYQTKTDSNYTGGDMWVNFSNHPMLGQRVHYESEIDGFTFAAQAGVGTAIRVSEKWIVALDVKRYFWDNAINTITVTAKNPDVQGASPVIQLPFVFDWKDQWVYAIGADYRATDRLTLRAGFNYGENPVPDQTLNPLFPATVESHLAVGASWLSGSHTYQFALQRAFKKDVTNNNPNPMVNPFGPGSRVAHEQWTASFSVSWAWARH